ncbi:TPA: hypothetical protein L7U93_002325 [Klebsiella pneumoniae]|jgi:hypothetical protein|uniref:hypothetical protein n=1 Tax=Klebsiella pneumoniae TaxID=573 RepID=UPI0007CBC26A|nr:hypothetical protein [Klebsiella pneumoniae]DAI72583.1 MAG TPA: CMP/hydroxymethyl CMP hydrolase [Caudoviricetes sp.]HCQ7305418.1 hypothetical protein [Klebsiella quasipneumoniae subsp. similipneumoniae]SAV33223.1 Uncharacterised protein [Klebsiella pneumoniae]HBQ2754276.1 hypothetical protein [Klebsiella pneumoniae]HBQ2759982.1 hypothetical protein [Klebsiella pneumoniae]
MTTSPKATKDKATEKIERTCFVIMPIADMAGYDSRHFDRVYNHLIKPACDAAGFTSVRADEVNNSNLIVLDILKRIVESDIAICDLSGRNPNVMYELGLRQAFNKKTVLIKDDRTISPFDVQAFRYCEYDSSLRIDNAFNNIKSLEKAITSTFEADSNDVNSIVQLLRIEPAKVGEKTQLSTQDTLIFETLNRILNKIDAPTKIFSNSKTIKYTPRSKHLIEQLKTTRTEDLIGKSYLNERTFVMLGKLESVENINGELLFVFRYGKDAYFKYPESHPELEDIVETDF